MGGWLPDGSWTALAPRAASSLPASGVPAALAQSWDGAASAGLSLLPCGLSADLLWLHPSPACTLLSQKVPGLAGAQQEALGTCGLHVGICFLGISESHWAQLWNLSLR